MGVVRRHATLLAALLLAVSTVDAMCFFPNGSRSVLDVPCNPGQQDSVCCYSQEACLSNKLCKVAPTPLFPAVRYNRGTCTDQNWRSAECPNFCLDVQAWAPNPMYSCNNTGEDSYCCNDNCQCNASFQFVNFTTNMPTTITVIGASGPFASATSSPATVKASAALSATTSAADSAASKSQAQKAENDQKRALGIGLGIGIPFALTIIGAVAYFCYRRGQDIARQRDAQAKIDELHNSRMGDVVMRLETSPSPSTGKGWRSGSTSTARTGDASSPSSMWKMPKGWSRTHEMPLGIEHAELPTGTEKPNFF
ncbi:MAG: hypothetical protein M1817_004611 [Caeruleum heppii]|nr:MAG: hypothetical protein M1817_004611 [Caeruleum heppii]